MRFIAIDDEGGAMDDSRHRLVANNEELRRRVAALESEAQRFRTTLNSIGDAVMSTDASGRVTQMNPIAEKLTGWPEAEARGKLLHEVFRIVNEETRAKVESPVVRILRDGMVVGLANHTLLVARDGAEHPIADSGAPIRDEGGKVTGFVLVFRDQTEERAAQKALRESEETFRAMAENANEGILVATGAGLHVFANRRAAEITGYSVEDLLEVSIKDLAHAEEFNKTVKERYEKILAGKPVPREYETIIVRKDHENVPVEVTSAKTNWHGRPADLVIFRDIRERRRNEEALRASEARFSTIFHASPIGLSTTRLADGQYVDVNEAFLGMFGYTREEAVSHTSIQLQTWASPDERDRMIRALREQGRIRNMEAQYRRKSGEIWTALVSAELIQVAGEQYSLSLLQDITERKRAEAALRQSEERNRTTLQSLGDAVISTDASGRVTQINPVAQALTGCSEAEALGQPLARVFRIVNEETRAEVESPVDRVLREGTVIGLANHTLLVARDGAEHPIADSGAPIRDEGGEVTGVVLVFRDQTEERAAQKAIQESARKFQDAVRYLDEGYYSCAVDGLLQEHNVAFARILGFNADKDLKGSKLPDFWQNPEDREEYLSELMSKGIVTSYLINAKTISGDKLVVMANAHLVRNENGNPVRIEGTFTDFTEHTRMEAALRESEERNRTTLQSLGDAVLSADASGRVNQMNPVAEKLTGWSEAKARGKLLHEVFRIVNEETHANVESPVAHVLRDGLVVGLGNHTLLIAKDGSERPIADSGAPIRNEKGETSGVVLVFRDQTEERAAQKALQESEAFNRTIVESIPQGLFLKDRNDVYLAVNEPYATSLGCRPEQLVGKDDFTFYPAELAEKHRTDDSAVMELGRVMDIEERYLAQGKEYWRHTIKAPVKDEAGHVTAVLGLFEDITDRKRVEQSLKDAWDRLEEAQRAAHLGNWEWNSVKDEITGSEEFYRLFDVAPEMLTRFSQFVERLHPEDRERVQQDVADALKQDRPYDTDYRVKLSDGGWRDIIARGRVFAAEDGKTVRMVGTCLDITERKRMEERISHLNLVLKAIRNVNQLIVREKDAETLIRRACEVLTGTRGYFSAWIALYDESGKCLGAAAAGLGETFESLENRIRSGQLAACGKALYERGVHVARNPSIECPNCPAAVLGMHQSAIAVRLEHEGHVHGLLVMSMDPSLVDLEEEQHLIEEVADDIAYALHGLEVEKRRSAAEEELRKHRDELEQRVRDRTAQLEESNKELEAFSYSVSHDLRAPLRAIDGFIRILADDYASHLNTEGKRLCSIVCENTGKMSRLIDDLLAFSRLGRAEMSLSRIDMGTMASSVFHELTTLESRTRIDFQVETVPPVVADPTLVRQVWFNLLSNAIKFSSKRERAVIKVSAWQSEVESVYSVQDNGAGFDMRYVQKLFGVFERLHSTREFEGTGVGLALAQRVIRRHGGRIWAEGEPDKGATFYFALPQRGA